MIQQSCVQLDLGPDSALIVIKRLQLYAHPVILVAALIEQNNGRAPEPRHNKIWIAISVDIRNGNSPRLIHLDRIEVHILGDVRPSFSAQIPQQPQFPSVARFSRSDKIEPTVVVVIEGGNPPAALPA